MIITEQKPIKEILDSLKGFRNIFLVGCGECATTCKTGGKEELAKIKELLEENGKIVVGMCVPGAPCVAVQANQEIRKNSQALGLAEAILVFACGLGVQSVKDNDKSGLAVLSGCNSLFGATMDKYGNFYEKCSLCGDCVLNLTAGICPITLCAKGLLNGPCGGVNNGKCELDQDKDCAWVLIYRELEKRNKLDALRVIQPPKDFKKSGKPRKVGAAK
jgi:ferredoxin